MTNKAIANAFDDLANIMELHDEDDFRVRTYRSTYINLRKLDRPLAEMTDTEIKSIKGVGPAISSKIRELLNTGKMDAFAKFAEKTPPGVVEMLQINGFGPKKIKLIWQEMGVETIGELLYACNENRLIEQKGFGAKTQEELKNKLEYYLRSRHQYHIDAAEQEADVLAAYIQGKLPGSTVAAVGELARNCPVIASLELLIGYDGDFNPLFDGDYMAVEQENPANFQVKLSNESKAILWRCAKAEFGSKQFAYTGSKLFLDAFVKQFQGVDFKNLGSEAAVFEKASLPVIAASLRENPAILEKARQNALPQLIQESDIVGVLHVHTQYSDGVNSLKEMCAYVKNAGFQYIGITDHSQSAFYANGLKPDRIEQQWAEIDALNAEMAPFKIFKGIESDILNDGSLDYPDELLRGFDFIIASVHSNLRMDETKATNRIVKAVENPFATILGHPTGRILLAREGYPLHWEKILDACAANGVAIELNANPHRLDIDWSIIPRALDKGIAIAINPDAHSLKGVHDIRYGVMLAQKGGVTAAQCFNTIPLSQQFQPK